MPTYLSPGVYVEEVPPLARPIAGVGTSTAGFIGIIPDSIIVPSAVEEKATFKGDGTSKQFPMDSKFFPVVTTPETFEVRVNENLEATASLENVPGASFVKFTNPPPNDASIEVTFTLSSGAKEEATFKGDGTSKQFPLDNKFFPVVTTPGGFEVRVNENLEATASLENVQGTSFVKFTNPPANGASIKVSFLTKQVRPVSPEEVTLCTTFNDFRKSFGDFSDDAGQRRLAHAVFGFFNNGGTRCYVVRQTPGADVAKVLEKFEAIDEIAIVAAPGLAAERGSLADHCRKMGDRFAIVESGQEDAPTTVLSNLPQGNSYAALYFPWISVFDPVTQAAINVPPSGHVAGIYARVDAQRGVHKAPANEPLAGAIGLQHDITKSLQDGLNPGGINCIRNLNGNIYVWGGRTMGGDANGEFKYVSTRRLFNFLRESIEEGTQFVVFEPNNPGLWQRIKRSVGDFLLGQWRAGALFGETPEKAFFVKCDAETNPSEVREAGQVVTQIGVAIVKPAEFVIFRIQQQTGG